jgi:hypothetical protein
MSIQQSLQKNRSERLKISTLLKRLTDFQNKWWQFRTRSKSQLIRREMFYLETKANRELKLKPSHKN